MNTTEQRPQTPEQATACYYSVIAPLLMAEGVGDGRTTACVMAQAATIDALRKGLTLNKPTDEMECCCPVLRRLAIRANDTSWWESNEERTEHLRPLIPLLLDSRGDRDLEFKRIFFIADNVVRVLTPMRLEWIAENTKSDKLKEDCTNGAKALREIPEITDQASALSAREVCRKFKDAAYASAYASASAYAYASASASASADASAYAYASAYASASASASASADASAYAYASAYASAYADASADASAYASADASADKVRAQKVKYRTAFLEMFKTCAALTRAKGGQG
jgi:hypothetical protein